MSRLPPEVDARLVNVGRALLLDDVEIDAVAAAHVLWLCAEPDIGIPPGNFTYALIECLQRADPDNRARLALLYTDYARAVHLAQTDNGLGRLAAAAATANHASNRPAAGASTTSTTIPGDRQGSPAEVPPTHPSAPLAPPARET